jgi:biopolymer transport protein ExbB
MGLTLGFTGFAAHAQTATNTAPAVVAPSTMALTTAPVLANAPAATEVKPASTTADNPYGLSAMWGQGDWVAKITVFLLIIMSLASWYVLISKLIQQNRLKAMAAEAEQAFAKATTLRAGATAMAADSPFRFIADASLEAVQQHSSVAGQVDLNTWAAQSIERSVATVQSNTQQGLAVLATVGSTAPLVVLFGTVWGIYNDLVKIGASGQASIDKVAGPVGEALIMTAIGLAVAVPAVLGYNWMVRRNKASMDAVNAFGSDLHSVLLASAKK